MHQIFRYSRLVHSLRDNLDCEYGEQQTGSLQLVPVISILTIHTDVGEDKPHALINFAAFVAHLEERRVLLTDPTWAIWPLRDAFEDDVDGWEYDVYVLRAAQWILWYSQSLFKQLLFSGSITLRDSTTWESGELYKGNWGLSLERWHFWRDCFKAAAASEQDIKEGKPMVLDTQNEECKATTSELNEDAVKSEQTNQSHDAEVSDDEERKKKDLHKERQRVAARVVKIMDLLEESMTFPKDLLKSQFASTPPRLFLWVR